MGIVRSSWLTAATLAALVAACGDSARDVARVEEPRSAAAAPASTAGAPAAARPRIVFLGDSLTAGLGLAPDQSVPSLIAERLAEEGYAYEVVNAGVSGDTTAGGVRRLDWSLEGDVAILVVELGGNDGLRGLPVDAMKRNLDEIVTRAKQRGITVLLTGMEAPPNYGPAYTSAFRQVFRDLARTHDVPFVPFFLEGVAGIPRLNQGDGIHPNAEGARVVAGTIWQALEPLLAAREERLGAAGTSGHAPPEPAEVPE